MCVCVCVGVVLLCRVGGGQSYPALRLFDMPRLLAQLDQFFSSLSSSSTDGGGSSRPFSLKQLASLQRILKKCARPDVSIPGIAAVFKADEIKAAVDELMRTAQVWSVHNTMDLGSADSERLCHCAVLTPAVGATGAGTGATQLLGPSCTGCF